MASADGVWRGILRRLRGRRRFRRTSPRKLLRKPWGTALMPFSRTSLLSVESESARPVGLGKMSPELSGERPCRFQDVECGR